jgi:signal transduction histidine kinase
VPLVGIASTVWRIPGWRRAGAPSSVRSGERLVAPRDSIRTRLVLLALLATAPLLILVLVNTSLASARQAAQMEALRLAQLHANLVDEHVQAVDTLLSALAVVVPAGEGDRAATEAQLRGVLARLPAPYTNLFLGPPTGREPRAPGSPGADRGLLTVGDRTYLWGALASGGLVLREPATSPTTGVILARPIVGPDGRVSATLNAETRLDRLPRLEMRDLPAGSVITILDERGVVLARSPDYEVWVGRDLGQVGWVQQALQRRQGSDELVDADGVTRLAAYTMATRVPWLVYVGLPSSVVLGWERVALLRNVWLGVLALALAVLLAWLIASRITAPLRRLAADASALGAGDLARRTRVDTRDEVGVLAAVFNQMAEAVERREAQLRDLVGRLQLAQEEERRRVASEVHDGLVQVAASAHQHLQTFADCYAPETPGARAALDRAVELVQRTVREARRVIAGLRPTALDDFGLATAIRLEVEALRAEGWLVSYDADLVDERLPPMIETALFRVAQEALTNVRKHAGHTRVAVSLRRRGPTVRLEVRDWGRGLGAPGAPDGTRPGERVGLLGMQERVALLGGRCAAEGRPGAGTRVVAEVPLPRPLRGGAARGA